MYRMNWTDGRLQERFDSIDHRFDSVDRQFDAVDKRFESLERRFESLERRMDDGFERVDADIGGLHSEMTQRFDALQRTLLQLGGGVIVALIGLIATQL